MLSSKLEEDLNKTYTVDGSSTSPMDVLKSIRKLQSRTSRVAEQAKVTSNSKQVKEKAALPLCRSLPSFGVLSYMYSVLHTLNND